MDEPITWGGYLMAHGLCAVGLVAFLAVLTVFVAVATRWEEWKGRKPDWKNDWED